jgi:hypothetical protein
MITHEISYSEDRENISEFIQLMPFGRVTSILSSPEYTSEKNLLKILRSFDIKVWILLILSYLVIYLIHTVIKSNRILKFIVAIDLFAILIGIGIDLIKFKRKF